MNPHFEFLLSTVYDGALAPVHRADLDRSGITEESRMAQGIRGLPLSDVARLVGFSVTTAVTSFMLIPYPDPAGGYFDMFQVKLFPAIEDGDGHSIKYLQPRHSRPRLYFTRSVLPLVMDPGCLLYVVEGAKKTICAAQLGLAAIGFAGIQSWHVRGSRRLLADFARIPLAGRAVHLVPDGDVQTNPDVERGAADFATAMEAAGARVDLVLLPVAA